MQDRYCNTPDSMHRDTILAMPCRAGSRQRATVCPCCKQPCQANACRHDWPWRHKQEIRERTFQECNNVTAMLLSEVPVGQSCHASHILQTCLVRLTPACAHALLQSTLAQGSGQKKNKKWKKSITRVCGMWSIELVLEPMAPDARQVLGEVGRGHTDDNVSLTASWQLLSKVVGDAPQPGGSCQNGRRRDREREKPCEQTWCKTARDTESSLSSRYSGLCHSLSNSHH